MTDIPAWLVDGHVHIHPVFDRARFFDAAAANFTIAARALRLPADTPGVLMLTESAGVDAFGDLAASGSGPGRWAVVPTEDAEAVAMARAGAPPIFVVAGRQLVTEERLEVLALGTRHHFADGMPLPAAAAAVRDAGAVPVVPWGFGKWTGTRRRLLADFLRSPEGSGVLLGDNGGRPALAPLPPMIQAALGSGRTVVPGSDPLPFASQVSRAGRYGFLLATGEVDPARPASTVVQFLLSGKEPLCPFGRLSSLPSFLMSQLRMQLRGGSPSPT